MNDLSKLLAVSEVARRLGVSKDTVRVWARSGRLRAIETVHGRLFDPEDVEELRRRRNTPD